MIGTNFKCLITSHDQACLAVFLVLQKTNITCASLLPLSRITIKLEKFGSHLERLFFSFFMSFGLNLFGQVDNRFEMNIGLFFICFFLYGEIS